MITLRDRNANIATPRPNWGNPVGVEYSFRTDIFTSRDGSEVRAATRQRARIALSFTTALTRPGMARHQQDMAFKQHVLWAVRAEWAWVRLSAELLAGGSIIDVPEITDWMVVGQEIIIETDTNEDLFTISAVNTDTLEITLSDNTTRDYPVGTKVYLAYLSRIAASSNFTAPTSRVWTGAVRYDVNPGEGAAITAVPPNFTFGFSNMFLKRPNWRDSPRISFDQVRDVFDPDFGLIDVFAPQAADTVSMDYNYTGLSKSQSDELVAFFHAMKGRRTSFWVPLWFDDIQPSDEQIGGADTIKIAGEDFRNAYDGHLVFRSVIAFYDDCTYQANTISGIGGTTDSEVTFENDWSQEINSRTKMYWLVKARFQSDTLDVQWLTNEAAEVTYSLRSLPHSKTPDWPIPNDVVALAEAGTEITGWGDMTLVQTTPSVLGDLVDLHALGITQEQIDAGDIKVGAVYKGTYQEGAPLVDDSTQFQLFIKFHDSGMDGPASTNADLVAALGGDITSSDSIQGPIVDMTLVPVTVPPTARWIQFRCRYGAAVTSSNVTEVIGYVITRPTTGSFAGTSLC